MFNVFGCKHRQYSVIYSSAILLISELPNAPLSEIIIATSSNQDYVLQASLSGSRKQMSPDYCVGGANHKAATRNRRNNVESTVEPCWHVGFDRSNAKYKLTLQLIPILSPLSPTKSLPVSTFGDRWLYTEICLCNYRYDLRLWQNG